MNLELFYSEIKRHGIFKQLLGREGMDEMIVSIESGRNVIDDHKWNRKKVRFCVQKIGDVSVLYYREKETGDSKRPSLRVVAVEDLWETLMGVHEQVCHGERTRMEKYFGRAWQSRASTSDTALPRSLPDLSGNKREEEHTEDCTQAYHPRRRWATRTGRPGGFADCTG